MGCFVHVSSGVNINWKAVHGVNTPYKGQVWWSLDTLAGELASWFAGLAPTRSGHLSDSWFYGGGEKKHLLRSEAYLWNESEYAGFVYGTGASAHVGWQKIGATQLSGPYKDPRGMNRGATPGKRPIMKKFRAGFGPIGEIHWNMVWNIAGPR